METVGKPWETQGLQFWGLRGQDGPASMQYASTLPGEQLGPPWLWGLNSVIHPAGDAASGLLQLTTVHRHNQRSGQDLRQQGLGVTCDDLVLECTCRQLGCPGMVVSQTCRGRQRQKFKHVGGHKSQQAGMCNCIKYNGMRPCPTAPLAELGFPQEGWC